MDIEKLAWYILREFPNFPFTYFLDLDPKSETIHTISMYMFGNIKYQSRYSIVKAFKRNTGNISRYFEGKFSYVEEIRPKVKKGKSENLLQIISSEKCTVAELNSSCSSVSSVYGQLCQKMKIKNSLKNRLKLKQRYQRSISNIKSNKQSIVSPQQTQLKLVTTSSVLPIASTVVSVSPLAKAMESLSSTPLTPYIQSAEITPSVTVSPIRNVKQINTVRRRLTVFEGEEKEASNKLSVDEISNADLNLTENSITLSPTFTGFFKNVHKQNFVLPIETERDVVLENKDFSPFERNYKESTFKINPDEWKTMEPVASTPLTTSIESSAITPVSVSPIRNVQHSKVRRRLRISEDEQQEDSNELSVDEMSNADLNLTKNSETLSPTFTSLYKSADKHRRVLPIGAKRVAVLEGKDCNRFKKNYKEGTFKIFPNEWKDIYCNNKLRSGYYAFVIKEKLRDINNTCIVNIKSWRVNAKKDELVMYAYCAHQGCKTFVLLFKNINSGKSDIEVDVFSSSKNFNHKPGKGLTRHVRGVERILFKKDLKTRKASSYRTDSVLKASNISIRKGNYQGIKSYSTLRKIRSEAMAQNDRSVDDTDDVILMRREHLEYIQSVGEPFFVYIFSKEQLELLAMAKTKDNFGITLHLDATGSVVKQPIYEKKRIYYYAGVVQTKNNDVCPVLEMISARHGATDIGIWLAQFKRFCIQNNVKWPAFKTIVIDFSFALLNSIDQFWNYSPSLIHYLDVCYNILFTPNYQPPSHQIFIKFCCCHYMKIVTKDINQYISNRKCKLFLKEVIASAFNFTQIEHLVIWFQLLVRIIKSPNKNPTVEEALQLITSLCSQMEYEKEKLDNTTNADMKEAGALQDDDVPHDSALYRNSRFYIHFVRLYNEECSNNIDHSGSEPNIYYSEIFMETILRKYIPYLPLWTAVIPKNKTTKAHRVSNAPVECWFGILKNNILNNQLNLKCTRFLRIVRTHLLAKHKENCLEIKKRMCASRKEAKSEPQEEWNKKKAISKRTYFKPVYLKQVIKEETDKAKNDSKITKPTKYPLLSNGIVDNPNYYVAIPGLNYYIGYFPLINYPIKELSIEDYQTLSDKHYPGDKWLTNFIIELCLELLLSKRKDVTIIRSEIATLMIFTPNVNAAQVKKVYPSMKEYIIIPTHTGGNHWCLSLANTRKKQFLFINPLGSSLAETRRHMEKFLSFYRQYLLLTGTYSSTRDWQPVIVEHEKQKDDYNCGVYIIQFAVKIMNEECLLNCDPEKYRCTLRHLLLQNSASVTNMCLYCGRQEVNVSAKWIQCELCDRWVHERCIPTSSTKRYSLPEETFICAVCNQQ